MKEKDNQYLDPRWQKLRLKILDRDDWMCRICGNSDSTLHVHHRYYIPGKKIWDYDLVAFATLCESCHEEETFERKEVEQNLIMAFKKNFFVSDLKEFVFGINCISMQHCSEVVSSANRWVLQNKKMQREIIDKYFKHLGDKNKKTKKDG